MREWIADVANIGFKSSLVMLGLLIVSMIFLDEAIMVATTVSSLIFGNSL